jgi:hypothetical protein
MNKQNGTDNSTSSVNFLDALCIITTGNTLLRENEGKSIEERKSEILAWSIQEEDNISKGAKESEWLSDTKTTTDE